MMEDTKGYLIFNLLEGEMNHPSFQDIFFDLNLCRLR